MQNNTPIQESKQITTFLGIYKLIMYAVRQLDFWASCNAICTTECPLTLKELSYEQFVLPVLDYTTSIWDPQYHKTINKIEMIQHRATHFVATWLPLEKRQQRQYKFNVINTWMAFFISTLKVLDQFLCLNSFIIY